MTSTTGHSIISTSSANKGKAQAAGTNNEVLPEIGGKFSSWAKEDQNLNELDELLMEHELLAENAGGQKNGSGRHPARVGGTGISASVHVRSAAAHNNHNSGHNKGGSPELIDDFEDVIEEFADGIEAGGGDLEDHRTNGQQKGNSSGLKQMAGAGHEDSNSFDLDNSDDLNRFIQKYETMLDGD